jgi:CRP-like cAMP-binding protein
MVLLDTLKSVRFLHDIANEHLRQIASVAELRDFPANAVVFREGQISLFLYLVVQGNVSLEINVPDRGRIRFETVGSGELLGWSPLLQAGPMTATARSLVPTQLIVLNAAQVKALCAHDTGFGYELVQRAAQALSQRLAATRLQLLDVYRDLLPVATDEGEPA